MPNIIVQDSIGGSRQIRGLYPSQIRLIRKLHDTPDAFITGGELGHSIGISYGSVKVLVHRIRKQLMAEAGREAIESSSAGYKWAMGPVIFPS